MQQPTMRDRRLYRGGIATGVWQPCQLFESILDFAGGGGRDVFGWPLSLAAMALKNLAGEDFEPCDDADNGCLMPNFDPDLGPGGGLFAETGADQRINPGLAMTPAEPRLPPRSPRQRSYRRAS